MDAEGVRLHPLVRLMKPLVYAITSISRCNAKATISDSGTITEESSILNFPAINIRDAMRGPEGMEEAAVMMTGLNWRRIQEALALLETQPAAKSHVRSWTIFAVPNVSKKFCELSSVTRITSTGPSGEDHANLMLSQFFAPEPILKGLPFARELSAVGTTWRC